MALVMLGIGFFFLKRKTDSTVESLTSPPEQHEKSDSVLNPKAKNKTVVDAETQHQTNSKSLSNSNQLKMGLRREVPENAIRGASSVDASEITNAKVEKPTLLENTPWKIWLGVRAFSKKNGKPESKILGEVNGFYLVEDSTMTMNNIKSFSPTQLTVVIDSRRNAVGVLTGVFSIILKEGISSEILTQLPDVKIINSFPKIRTYYVTSTNEPFDLQTFQGKLKQMPDIESVQPEILSRQYEKN
ncbi:MAG: hypothetical protein ACXVCN_04275 [Bdellovibrio sp.]